MSARAYASLTPEGGPLMRPIYDCGHAEPRAECAGVSCARFRRAWSDCARVTMKNARRDSRARCDAAHRHFLARLRASAERLNR